MEKIYTPAAAFAAIAFAGGLLIMAERGPGSACVALLGTAVSLSVLAGVLALPWHRDGNSVRDDRLVAEPVASVEGSRIITTSELLELSAVPDIAPCAEVNV